MGLGFGGGLGAEPPAAKRPLVVWGFAAGGKGVWERGPSVRRFLQFFNKNNVFLCIFRPK